MRPIKCLALASYPVTSVKKAIERVENIKSQLQLHVPNPQASPRVEANDSGLTPHPLSTPRKVQMETPESIRTSLRPGEWVLCQTRTFLFPSSKLKEVLDTVLGVDNKSGEVRPQPGMVVVSHL